MHLAAAARRVVARVAEVVLHVAVALDVGGQERAFELGEDHLVGLAQDVGEHVQAAAVRHAHDDLFDPAVAGVLDQGVEQRNERLGALEGEALLADVLGVEELFEALGGGQRVQDVLAIVGAQLAAC